jgi:DNA-binding response OmpR family regulator
VSKVFARPLYDEEQKPRPVVLIVDDDPDVCGVIVASLAQKDFRIECAYSAEEALQRLATGRIDVALIDLLLPGGPGVEVAKRFAANGASVIIMSGALDAEERLAGTGFKLLRKPFRLKTLVGMVRGSLCGPSDLRPSAARSRQQPEPSSQVQTGPEHRAGQLGWPGD